MSGCVVDASAVVAVLFREPGFEAIVNAIPADATLYAPSLLPLEVANVARTKVRRNEVSRTAAETLIEDLRRWRIRRVVVAARPAWDLAWSHGLTVYDAAYLHVAIARDLPLVTLDADLHGAAGRRARP